MVEYGPELQTAIKTLVEKMTPSADAVIEKIKQLVKKGDMSVEVYVDWRLGNPDPASEADVISELTDIGTSLPVSVV